MTYQGHPVKARRYHRKDVMGLAVPSIWRICEEKADSGKNLFVRASSLPRPGLCCNADHFHMVIARDTTLLYAQKRRGRETHLW